MENFEGFHDFHGVSSPGLLNASRNYNRGRYNGSKIRDPHIVSRVNQYLCENKDKVYFNLDDMVDTLRKRYREYRRRSWSEFKTLVERAFAVVSKQSKINSSRDLDSSRYSSSEIEECDNEANKSISNDQVNKLYRNQTSSSKPDDAELIDLSSDDNKQEQDGSSKSRKATMVKMNHVFAHDTTVTVLPEGAESSGLNIPVRTYNHPGVTISRKRKLPSRTLDRQNKKISPSVTFADFAGNSAILEEVCKLIVHIKHPEVFEKLGVSAPRGFLLHGPPGSGKTLLASAIAGELNIPLIKVSGPELVGGVSGESEQRIRELFGSALDSAPCVLFIDEVDAITPNRQNAQREMERRIVAQLLTSLDDLALKDEGSQVLIIGATNRPDSLDPSLRRAGRFDREVCLGIPDQNAREQILKVICNKLSISDSLNFGDVARTTPGYVGADLLSLVREAVLVAISRVFDEIKDTKEQKCKKKRLKNSDIHLVNGSNAEVKRTEDATREDGSSKEEKNQLAHEKNEEDDTAIPEKTDGEETKEKDEISVPEPMVIENNDGNDDSDMDVVGTDSDLSDVEEKEYPVGSSLMRWLRKNSRLSSRYLARFTVSQADFVAALKIVQPSAKREGFATVPDVTWDDIGSLAKIRDHLKMTILGPLKYSAHFERLGLVAPAGVLLCGPPGCGKTLLAKAVANEAGINFISVKGPELLNMYVGESERAVRTCFQRARNSAPCVIFFDEIDALCPRRVEGDVNASARVVNQLLTEMDGVGDRRGVYLMAATNRVDIVDPAVLRPGRLDKVVFVGLPDRQGRVDILRAVSKNGTKPPLDSDVSFDEISGMPELENYTGADLAALVHEASMECIRECTLASESDPSQLKVNLKHFMQAIRLIRPSVSPEDLKRYEEVKRRFSTDLVSN